MKLVVISIDAIDSNELINNIDIMPNVKRIIDEGSYVKHVKSVTPSLTYPSHATIVTGVEPDIHGVINNKRFKSKEWFFFRKDIKVRTIFEELIDNDYNISSVFWPVSNGVKFRYSLAEIWGLNSLKTFARQLKYTSLFMAIKSAFTVKFSGGKSKYSKLDDYMTSFALNCVKKGNSDALFIHLLELDCMKHILGTKDAEMREILKRTDKRIGRIISKLDDDATVVILGDHSQKDVHTKIDLNQHFKENDIDAYASCCNGMSYIYTSEDIDFDMDGILSYEKFLDREYKYKVFYKDGFYSYKSTSKKAHHGYINTLDNYRTVFIAKGPKVKSGFVIENGSLLDHAGTILATQGIKFNDRVVNIIKEEE